MKKEIKPIVNIPEDANQIIHILQQAGYPTYVVGGCVRDSILGRTPHDWDICTAASPQQMMEVLKDEHIIPTGLQHGTLTIMRNHEPYEITTFRQDGEYTDHRRPNEVTFTTNITKDLSRRDFTINAMAYNDEEGLIDPYHGAEDIKNETIRCVGEAKKRFNEDALRIMRAIRFAAVLDFKIDKETEREIYAFSPQLKYVSMERINSELSKIGKTTKFSQVLQKYPFILKDYIPEFTQTIGFAQNNNYHIYTVEEHIFQAISEYKGNDLMINLALLLHDIGKPQCYIEDEQGIGHFPNHAKVSSDLTKNILHRLKYDNKTRDRVAELVENHDRDLYPTKSSMKRLLNHMEEPQIRRLFEIRKADIKAQNPIYKKERLQDIDTCEKILGEILQEQQCFSLKDLVISGKDLMNIGFLPGKELGDTLEKILTEVIRDNLPNEKEVLLDVARGFKFKDEEQENNYER